MYDRVVTNAETKQATELNFFVSGKLWNRSLIMGDDKTDGEWSHLLGECKTNALIGTKLEAFPSVLVDWASWKEQHPKTTVIYMERRDDRYSTDFYTKESEPKNFVAGINIRGKAKAYRFSTISDRTLINDSFEGAKLVIFFDQKSMATWCWNRDVDEQSLSFQAKTSAAGTEIIDIQTESVWNLRSGVCISGELEGKQLRQIVVIPSFSVAWKTFYPDSEYWSPPN